MHPFSRILEPLLRHDGWNRRRLLAKIGLHTQPELRPRGFIPAGNLLDEGDATAHGFRRWQIHPAEMEEMPPPRTIEEGDAGGFAPYRSRLHPPACVYRLPEVYYLGKHCGALSQERLIYADLLDAAEADFPPELTKRRASVCDGPAYVLSGSKNHFHWLLKMLPRLHLLEATGIRLDGFERLFINRPLAAHAEAYGIAGIPGHLLRTVGREDFWLCRELYTATIPHTVPGWAVAWLRERFAPLLRPRPGLPKLIYLTRGGDAKRLVRNEAEVRACMEGWGAATVDCARHSFAEQAALFANADLIVAPHGAALANTVFARPGARLLEIFANANNQKCYWMIAHHNRLRYHYLMAQPAAHSGNPNHTDMIIPIEKLNRAMEFLAADYSE